MLTKKDLDDLFNESYFTNQTGIKESVNDWREDSRMRDLMKIVENIDANDPQKIMSLSRNGGTYGYEGLTNVDVATVIFRFATHLENATNFDKVMSTLQKRGIPSKTFGDAFAIMQKFEHLFPGQYQQKVMDLSHGQYSPELYDVIQGKSEYKASDPFFKYALEHKDIKKLQQYDVDFDAVMQIDASKDAFAKNTGANFVKKISSKDGKHFAFANLHDIAELQRKAKIILATQQIIAKTEQQNLKNMAINQAMIHQND